MPGRLENRVALVAGAGSIAEGMSNGRAVSLAYAREGAKVVAVDLSLASAEETRDLILAEGGSCIALGADMSKSSEVAAVVAEARTFGGAVDILHNNIGILKVGGAIGTEDDDWDRIVTVNLRSLFLACKHVLPLMAEQGRGVITNVGSIASQRYTGLPMLAYATTKGAVPTFTRSVALEYAGAGVRANCIHPGVIDTPLQRVGTDSSYGAMFGKEDRAAMRARREATIPLGRFGTPFDVANAAVFLASDEASYITGTELVVDGGFIQRAGG